MATATKIKQMDQPPEIQASEAVTSDEKFRKLSTTPVSPGYGKTDQPVTFPHQALLGFVRDGRLLVYSPIRVKFTQEGQHIIAEAVEFNEFGFGENESEALTDLQRAIVELYFTLEKEQERLGSDLQNVWGKLQKMIRVR